MGLRLRQTLVQMNRIAVFAFASFTVFCTSVFLAEARPVYARQEGKACGYCHVRPQGGGARGFRGQFYGANNLSFQGFDEKRESRIAGVMPDSEGVNMVPSISYNGNVSGPATQQIQLASLRGPVLLLFLDKADDPSKLAVKAFGALAKAMGNKATLLGVTRNVDALKLTEELGGTIRVYPDPDGAAVKKFSPAQALDVAAVAKMGDPVKTFPGFSRANLEAAVRALDVPALNFDFSLAPEKPLRGGKL